MYTNMVAMPASAKAKMLEWISLIDHVNDMCRMMSTQACALTTSLMAWVWRLEPRQVAKHDFHHLARAR